MEIEHGRRQPPPTLAGCVNSRNEEDHMNVSSPQHSRPRETDTTSQHAAVAPESSQVATETLATDLQRKSISSMWPQTLASATHALTVGRMSKNRIASRWSVATGKTTKSLTAAIVMLVALSMVTLAAPLQASAAVTPSVPPGVGAYWANSLRGHSQVIVADGANNGTTNIKLTLWTYVGANRWRNDGSYAAVGGTSGWNKTRQGDRRSPTGVFALTDAGGYYPNPGTRLPYQRSTSAYSTVLEGTRVFSYVVAIGYNRVAGTPPSSTRTTMGYAKGTQIWIHERHRTGSAGCIGTSRAGVVKVLRWLNPAAHPVILMGPHSTIVRAR
jgi:L,D-peptidoglycan transpeptidase YkuD (ErfK/YbiS/YcfS/YnhG family)